MADNKKTPTKSQNYNSANTEPTPTSSGGLVWLVVFIGVIGAGAWVFWPEVGPKIKPLIAKVRGISTPEDFAPPPAPVARDVTPEPETIAAPTPTPAATPTVMSTPAPDLNSGLVPMMADIQKRLTIIEQRLTALESRPQPSGESTSSAQVLVLATTQLAARLGGEGSFKAELDVLEKVAVNDAVVDEAVRELRPHADAGVPTVRTLAASFENVSRAVMRARLNDGDDGWVGKVKNKLGNLVTIRRTDPATTSDPIQRALALGEDALGVGALDEAVDAVSSIKGAAGLAAAPWLGDAMARLLVDGALEKLHNHALSKLGATNTGG